MVRSVSNALLVLQNGNVEIFEISDNYIHDNNNIGIDIIGYEGSFTYSNWLLFRV